MRGKVFHRPAERGATGITPAYAGKSCGRCCCVCVTEDHPRLCGEKIKNHLNGILYPGSPPPMRGKGLPEVEG